MMASPARVATAVQEALNHRAAKGIARARKPPIFCAGTVKRYKGAAD
jgi:hypothetical protein